jgi:hypothetical protein
MKKLFSISLLFIAVLVGCKDDDAKIDVSAQLTAATKGWILESIKVTGDPTNTNIVDSFDDCEKDDSFIFTSDGKYTIANNELKCGSDGATVSTGTWSLNTDKTVLTVTDPDGTTVINKLSVTDSNITGEFNEDGATATVSFKKKS